MPTRADDRGDEHTLGRITARPGPGAPIRHPAGVHPLVASDARDALLFVPRGAGRVRGDPLLVMLHGAGGNARGALDLVRAAADEEGVLVLAPESSATTWDVIRGDFGPDVAFVDAALARVFAAHTVDPRHIAVAGFSDGASYALTLGLANGDLFDAVLAFSPGFVAVPGQRGSPRVFVSHGTDDRVLPIGRCSRLLVPRLQASGYDVRYDEFAGPHSVPAETARTALRWWLGGAAAAPHVAT